MSYELSGVLLLKSDTQQVSNTFQKRDFVVETDGQYPKPIKLELTNDKCGLLDAYDEGAKIKVHFNLDGREWNGKYFVNLKAWKIEGETQAEVYIAPPLTTMQPPNPIAEMTPADDDLPF